MTTSIARLDPDRLAELEAIAESHRESALKFWDALTQINEAGLYKGTHRTFATYVQERWSVSRSHAYRQIAAAKVVKEVKELVPHGGQPANERAARAITPSTNLAALPETFTAADVKRATPPSRPTPPPLPPQVVDENGTPVAGDAVEAFERRDEFSLIANAVHDAMKATESLAAEPVGRALDWNVLSKAFEDIKTAIRWAAPFAVCPMGRNCSEKCRCCKGSKWITKSAYAALPAGLKLAA